MFCHHISKKSDRQRNRSHKVTDDFQNEHKNHQWDGGDRPNRTKKMLHIFDSVNLQSIKLVNEKNWKSHGCCTVYIACRRFKSRDQTEQITGHDIQEYSSKKGIKCFSIMRPDIVVCGSEKKVRKNLHHILKAGRDKTKLVLYSKAHSY